MRTQWLYLSYPLNSESPFYGGQEGFLEKKIKEIKNGDSCNTRQWCFTNHAGTHIDFPLHFSVNGRSSSDYDANFWIFKKIHTIHLDGVAPGDILGLNDINLNDVPDDTQILMVKTGFGAIRKQPIYWQDNPGFDPEIADKLRIICPNLRVIGVDVISVSSFKHRDIGRAAHKAFLDHSHPILILEDMNLSAIDRNCKILQVVVSPLQVSGADGAPCTVLAEILQSGGELR